MIEREALGYQGLFRLATPDRHRASRDTAGDVAGERREIVVQLETYGFAEAGSEVLYSNTSHSRGREGMEVIARSTLVNTVENGQITRIRMFQERAEALEAVGLSE